MKLLSVMVAAIVLIAAQSRAQGQYVSPGLKVGKQAPEIKLKDQNGEVRNLKELTEDGLAALVFYRSADW